VGPAAYNAALNLPSLPFREFKKFAPVVFCAHQYSPSDYTESAKTNYGPEEKKDLDKAFTTIDAFQKAADSAPVFIGEFGVVRWAGPAMKPDSHLFLADEFTAIEKRNLNQPCGCGKSKRSTSRTGITRSIFASESGRQRLR